MKTKGGDCVKKFYTRYSLWFAEVGRSRHDRRKFFARVSCYLAEALARSPKQNVGWKLSGEYIK